ncbi:MAG: metallophosphoesterase [Deltaproteobacteria bacterium]|nr:metallophosphoesterase [Deltaproteobacteria bacterium]
MKDLIIISDFHLGEGRRDKRRYAPTEDFFHDEDFSRFLEYIDETYNGKHEDVTLVLNGDIFDFLTVTTIPSESVAKEMGFQITGAEKRFGLHATAAKSVFKLNVIAKGHSIFFKALSRFIAKGYQVEILRGNHDLELFFPEVQQRLLHILASVRNGATWPQLKKQVRFHQLFYREPGRVHIEHGHQYDATNSNRFPLNPVFWRKHKIGHTEIEEETLDYPIGSVFVKYFYNRVRRFDPYAPRLLSPEQYLDFIRRYNVFDVWRVYKDHYPYFIAALSPSTDVGVGGISKLEKIQHQTEDQKLAKKAGIEDFYRQWEDLKVSPEPANKAAVVKKAMEPLVRRAMWGGVFAFGVLYMWILFFTLIQEIPWLAANAFIMAIFAALTIIGAFWVWSHFRSKMKQWNVTEHQQMKIAATKLAGITDAKIMIFGHSHQVANMVLNDQGQVYANSGTWTVVSNPWNRIVRDARRLTFLRVKKNDVELLRWNIDGIRFDPVPLFYLDSDVEAIIHAEEVDDDLSTNREHSWLPGAAFDAESEQTDDYE